MYQHIVKYNSYEKIETRQPDITALIEVGNNLNCEAPYPYILKNQKETIVTVGTKAVKGENEELKIC